MYNGEKFNQTETHLKLLIKENTNTKGKPLNIRYGTKDHLT